MAPAQPAHWTVDESPASTLIACNHCHARFIGSRRETVMRELASHLRAGHADPENRHALNQALAHERNSRTAGRP